MKKYLIVDSSIDWVDIWSVNKEATIIAVLPNGQKCLVLWNNKLETWFAMNMENIEVIGEAKALKELQSNLKCKMYLVKPDEGSINEIQATPKT